ncbi:MAG: Gfo/Idh/MocA family oxidoreductase [Treponema sp.]|nr:Gfo/Idh/MocA family oxidoreductase [Treponema sp.]
MKKIRIGVMGGASIAERLMIPAILSLNEIFELVAIASRTYDNAQKFKKIFNIEGIVGYDNLIKRNDIDAIYMPLPTGLHKEWINKAIDANKHILAEKSLAMNFKEAQELVNKAKDKKLLLMENFMFRYHSQHKYVFSLLENIELGDIRLFRSQFGFPPLNDDNFRYKKDLGGGSLLDAAAYTVRVCQWFLGEKQKLLSAVLYMKNDIDLYGNAVFINKDDIVSQLSFGFDNYYKCNYEIWGSKGNIVAERAFTPKEKDNPVIILEKNGNTERIKMEADNHFVNLLKEFYNSIINDNYSLHLEDILNQSRMLTDIYENAIKVNI